MGTGVAPLIAARRLLAEGRSVLVLNPDYDFFREDSELSLSPVHLKIELIKKNFSEKVYEVLSPEYPGAVEIWPKTTEFDPNNPKICARTWFWLSLQNDKFRDHLEAFYLEAMDVGFKPQYLEGAAALRKLPTSIKTLWMGKASPVGVGIAKLADVDVVQYRNGLLEFLLEKLGTERLISATTQIEFTADGIRFFSERLGKRQGGNVRVKQAVIVFWSPHMTHWITSKASEFGQQIVYPKGIQIWEEWSLLSPEVLDPSVVGVMGNTLLWAKIPAQNPNAPLKDLTLLRPGALLSLTEPLIHQTWATAESFESVSYLCKEVLGWERLTVRGLYPRALLEWDEEPPLQAIAEKEKMGFGVWISSGGDGALIDVVDRARKVTELLL